jgi:hypothetical protein
MWLLVALLSMERPILFLGITRKWVAANGAMSLNAKAYMVRTVSYQVIFVDDIAFDFFADNPVKKCDFLLLSSLSLFLFSFHLLIISNYNNG